jgi:hypothetical protein
MMTKRTMLTKRTLWSERAMPFHQKETWSYSIPTMEPFLPAFVVGTMPVVMSMPVARFWSVVL